MSTKRIQQVRDLLQRHGVSEDGSNSLIQLFDPFHDTDVPTVGWTDGFTGDSVVACIEKSITIAAPTGQASGNWDCNIFTMPYRVGNTTLSGTGAPAISVATDDGVFGPSSVSPTTPGVASKHLSCLNIVAVNANADSFPYPGYSTAANQEMNILDMGVEWLQDKSRLVGMGFEVANTTAEIYQQGSVAYYYLQNSNTHGTTTSVAAASGAGVTPLPLPCVRQVSPPGTFSQAVILPGSVIRKAAEGAYVVARFRPENDFAGCFSGVVVQNPKGRGYFEAQSSGNWPTNTTAPATAAMFTKYPTQALSNIETSGAYFAGLSYQTTLTITARFYVEIAPSATSSYVALRHPAPRDDPLARFMYQKIASALPPGVPVAENAEGDWWDTILTVAKSALPVLGGIVGSVVPGAGLLGSALGGVAGGIQAVTRKQEAPPVVAQVSGARMRPPVIRKVQAKKVVKMARPERLSARRIAESHSLARAVHRDDGEVVVRVERQ